MERLTKRCEEDGVKAVWFGEKEVFLEGEVGYKEANKLAHYEDLEQKLYGIYGECDGLLELIVDHFVKWGGEFIGDKPAKSRLLTDEDVDKWLNWKSLDERGLLVDFPLSPGDTFWELNLNNFSSYLRPTIYPRTAHGYEHCYYVKKRLGTFCFLSEKDAQTALDKLDGGGRYKRGCK